MEYLGFIFGVFGLVAFLGLDSLKKRVRDLEKQMSALSGTDYATEKLSLMSAARGYIGQSVQLRFKEGEEDPDATIAAMKMGTCTLVDVDQDWILVHIEHNKTTQDKLIRLDSIQSIGTYRKPETEVPFPA